MQKIFEMFGLGEFYIPDENIAIISDDYHYDESVWQSIKKFMVNNEDWVLTHQDWGRDEGCWILSEI